MKIAMTDTPSPDFRNITLKYNSETGLKIISKEMIFVSLFNLLLVIPLILGMFAVASLIFSILVIGVLGYVDLFSADLATINWALFGVSFLILTIRSRAGILFSLSQAGAGTLTINKDKISARFLDISVEDVAQVSYSMEVDDSWEGGLMENLFHHSYAISLLNEAGESIYETISSKHDGPLLIEYLSNILQVDYDVNQVMSIDANQENNIDENDPEAEEKIKRSEEYHDWDSKSFGRWISDYILKFVPRVSLLVIGLTLFIKGTEYL